MLQLGNFMQGKYNLVTGDSILVYLTLLIYKFEQKRVVAPITTIPVGCTESNYFLVVMNSAILTQLVRKKHL